MKNRLEGLAWGKVIPRRIARMALFVCVVCIGLHVLYFDRSFLASAGEIDLASFSGKIGDSELETIYFPYDFYAVYAIS